ncbi:thiopeptide-type bacteriocin biosynthesis domain-containing protein [Amycolatopsis pretoriensis]|uniref:Thiopeptide-type bacteriocin biosynthesis domain-containing protein n=1 Tax=Amycolatopsis pretoriensis TaxID=218821 RepID=A0A1H5RKR9_9PSEU|nr:thiopeptide-type bacteriocin biosynthesis protein [Amycolatopsis pretoriensis]SEF38107.1 thiopeptide-type bacteriocin biosynthesis domain-containing protein [Amycolatopsis pretoriensis]
MPADHLTGTSLTITPSPTGLNAAVLAVLAGADPADVAVRHALGRVDLDDAVRTYHAAGVAALERRAEDAWYQVRVQFADWSAAETVGATMLGPALDDLRACEAIAGWWFLRKHPCWRLRLLRADAAAVDRVLDQLAGTDVIARWWPTVYEPETAAFGGATGIDTVHELFCADSAGVLAYLRHDVPGLGRRELSVLLLSGLMRATGLDAFECGDVFDRVARVRPAPTDADTERLDKLVEKVRLLLSIADLAESELFTPGGPVAYAAPWLAAMHVGGERLGHDAAAGRLDRGLRAILTHVVIFHWNRFGLSATSQGLLARAAATALLPRS